jgi:flotillin
VAQLESKRAEYDQKIKIARIESEKNAQKRQEEMQREVEAKRLERETEASRAENLSKARVQSEVKEAIALGDANAMRQMADASFYKRQREIEAVFYEKEREAEAKRINLEAEALGIGKVLQALGNDHKTLVQYLMLEKNLYPQLADASAKAIQGLNPKITVWSTGGDSTSNAYSNIQGLAKSIPPLIETIEDQTNLRLPDWLMKRKSDVVDKEVAVKLAALQEKKPE